MCLHVATAEHTLAAASASTKFPQSAVEYGVETSNLRMLCLLLSGGLSPVGVPSSRWPHIVEAAQEHNLGPLLSWVLENAQVTLPEVLEAQLMRSTQRATVRFMMLHRAQQDISQALEGASIPHVWLKGIVLAETVYSDPIHRPMVDLDVLVRPEHIEAALTCLQHVGFHHEEFQGLFDPTEQARQGTLHHHVLVGGPAQLVVLELHHRLMNTRSRAFLSKPQEHWFFQNTTSYEFNSRTFVSLSSEAMFLHLCAHAVLHHGLRDFAPTRLLDLHQMVTTCSVVWDTVVERAVELGWTYVVRTALQHTQQWFLTEIPPEVVDELRRHLPSDTMIRRVEALARQGAVFERYRWHLGGLRKREQLKWVTRVVLPTPAYMHQRYRIPDNRPVWPYYLRRWGHQFYEVIVWVETQCMLRARIQ